MKSQLLLFVGLATLLCGCGPTLSHQQDYSLQVGDILEIPINPINQEQTIKVSATSPGKPINVHVYLQEHSEAVNRMITLGKPPENLLANQNDAEAASLEATVPAGKEVVVRLQPAGSTSADVHLEITN